MDKLPPIPEGEYGETYPDVKGKIPVCQVHHSDWTKGKYIQEKNGAIVCPECGWGTRIPGYMRIVDGKVVDLRVASSQ